MLSSYSVRWIISNIGLLGTVEDLNFILTGLGQLVLPSSIGEYDVVSSLCNSVEPGRLAVSTPPSGRSADVARTLHLTQVRHHRLHRNSPSGSSSPPPRCPAEFVSFNDKNRGYVVMENPRACSY
jgi:hypothetical protein